MARTILITGCSSGIGYHAAHALRGRGWTLVASARKAQDVERLRSEGLAAVRLDLADDASIRDGLVEALDLTGGRLDALFNNGAYAQPGAIEDLSSAALRAQFDAGFFGWHALTKRAIPAMRARRTGRIVMNSSVLGLVALGFRGAYNSMKFALEGYSDTLRIELEGSGIHVAVIEPGPIESRFTQNAMAMFRRNIDVEGSVHRDFYRKRLASMARGGNTSGQLGPEAVCDALVHACESANPKTHYRVTRQAEAASALRRVMPRFLLHRLMVRATGSAG